MPGAHDTADSWISDIAGESGEWPLARTIRSRGGSTKPGSAGRLKAPELLGKCSFRYHYRNVPAPLPPSVRFFFSFLFFSWVRDWCVGYSRKSRLPDPCASIDFPTRWRNFSHWYSFSDETEVHVKEAAISRQFNLFVFKIIKLFLSPLKSFSSIRH